MDGPAHVFPRSLRLARQAESSRLQLELVRRAFELLVPNSRHPVAQADGTRRTPGSAAAVAHVSVTGG